MLANRKNKKRSFRVLVLTVIVFIATSCSEDPKFTGSVEVNFRNDSFDLFDGAGLRHIEDLRLGIFPTDFEDSFAFDHDAIAVSSIEFNSCRFDNILMGTYKVGFMEYPRIFKTIQVVPEQTTQVIMLD